MPADLQKARDLFLHAVGKLPPNEWDSYVEMACDGDSDLVQQLSRLLQVHRDAGSFLDAPAPGLRATFNQVATERPGMQIGPYKLLQQIGEGGMGTVFMAEQTEPVQRKVALKVIKPGMDSRQIIARFEAERQALALMDHINIARVLDAGTTGGRPYFVMELVHGIPVTQYCDENHLSPRARLELFVPVCQAIQHAHQKGIIHRDIKPSNVMVTLYDGQPVPKVIDFGVAKATEQKLTERTLFTQFGTMVGTLEYMSPEQAETSALGIDTRSDIYSLGVLLYELLTGSTPLCRERIREIAYVDVLRIIKEEEPPRPSTRLNGSGERLVSISAQRQMEPTKLTKLVQGELDWIVMKCLEKDRGRRYESANGIAADVTRYLNDEPVQACPPSTTYRFRKFARRNKAAIAVALGVGLAVVLGVVGLTASLLLIAHEQHETETALQTATAAKNKMEMALAREVRTVETGRREAYFQRITLANHELSVDNLLRARKLLKDCPSDLQKWEWRYLMRQCVVEPLIIRGKSEVNCVAFSRNGERLVSGHMNGEIKIWDSHSGRAIKSYLAQSQPVVAVVFHPDGKHLASVGLDRRVKVWDLTTYQDVFNQPCDAMHRFGSAHTVAFDPGPGGRRLATGSGGAVQVWDWRNSQLRNSFAGHQPRSISVAYSRDGLLASGDWRGNVKLWDASSEGASQPVRVFTKPPDVRHPACALAFNHDGSRLASASFNRHVDVWDTKTGKHVHALPHSDGLVLCTAFSPEGDRIASSGEDKTVHVWDALTGREILGLRGHSGQCGCVSFSTDGHRLASASLDGTIRVWDATPLVGDEAQEIVTFTEHDNEIWTIAISPDGKRVASAGFSTPAKVWDLQTGRVSGPDFTGHGDISFKLAWHPSGERLASAGSLEGKFTFKTWDVRTGLDLLPTVVRNGQEFFTVAFSPQGGKYLVTGRADGTVQAWDSQTGDLRKTLIHGDMIRGVAFSASGRQLATLSADGMVKVWPWDSARVEDPSWTPEAQKLAVRAWVPGPCSMIAFSPDGRLAIGTEGNTVQTWDVESNQLLQTFRGHSDDVYAVAFSPDDEGRWIATAGADSTVKVWNSHTGSLARNLRGHTGLVSSLGFTPDGKYLVSGSRDRTVKVWDATQLDTQPDH